MELPGGHHVCLRGLPIILQRVHPRGWLLCISCGWAAQLFQYGISVRRGRCRIGRFTATRLQASVCVPVVLERSRVRLKASVAFADASSPNLAGCSVNWPAHSNCGLLMSAFRHWPNGKVRCAPCNLNCDPKCKQACTLRAFALLATACPHSSKRSHSRTWSKLLSCIWPHRLYP